MTENLYAQDELKVRQKAYRAAFRSLPSQSMRYLRWLYITAEYDSEKEYLRGVIANISESYCRPH